MSTERGSASRGFTLPELLIVVTMMGMIATVMAGAMTVTVRQAASSEGRINVARAETAIDTWLPADLASTDVDDVSLPAVDLDPAAEPCGNCGSIDLSGANAMQLAWEQTLAGQPPVTIVTRVQYQYIEIDDEWVMRRIECVGADPCSVATMLRDLPGPEDPLLFDPDTDRPLWVMDVAVPEVIDGLDLSANARRIVVTVNGGGASAGAGGGINTINLTAGGRSTDVIAADDFTVPSFVRARSRCGGPVTLIVDDSGSIGSSNVVNVVRPGVEAFIEAFRGTPTQVQVIRFSSDAEAIGPAGDSDNGGWHRYIDMTDDAAVDALIDVLDDPAQGFVASGGTNWEDAFFHTFKESDGSPAVIQPNRLVFFTDGIPTRNRTSRNRGWMDQYSNGAKNIHFNAGSYNTSRWGLDDGSNFNQESWDRADVIFDDYRSVDSIFVGVGGALNNYVNWYHKPEVYENPNATRPARVLKRAWETIAYLLANAPTGQVPAEYDPVNEVYTNPETADFYLQSSFDADAFAAAMRAAALKDCGGTVTVQTRETATGESIADEFVYENLGYRDDDGDPIDAEVRRVTTSRNFRTGTFDFEITNDSNYFEVDIVPSELQTLDGYTMDGWSCRVGGDTKTVKRPIAITGSSFEGIVIDVLANEAVSCTMWVSQ